MSLWATVSAAALAGVLSLPHCAAMCGPLAMASCARGGRTRGAHYLLGRLAGYAAMGALLGAVGYRWVAHSSLAAFRGVALAALVAWCGYRAAAAVMQHLQLRSAWTGAATAGHGGAGGGQQLVALRPSRSRGDGPEAPRRGRVWRALSALVGLRPRSALGMGLITAILPCGALVAAWLLAGATAHPLLGSVSMVSFAVASSPALLVAIVGRELLIKAARRIPPLAGAGGWLLLAGLLVARWWMNAQAGASCCH